MNAQLTANLYRRPAPNTQLPGLSYLPMGSSLVVRQWVSGEHLDGNNLWAAADDGYYYWGGGLNVDELATAATPWPQLAEDVQISLVQDFLNNRRLWLQQQTTDYRGCAIGYKNDDTNGQIGLTVYVGTKQAGTLPKLIRWKGVDIPVDVKETNGASLQLNTLPDQADPMELGGSIARTGSESYGSRGAVLSLKRAAGQQAGQRFLLTCAHVLHPTAQTSTPIRYDGTNNGNAWPTASLPFAPRLYDNLPLQFLRFSPIEDFAIVGLTDQVRIHNRLTLHHNRTAVIYQWLGYDEVMKLKDRRLFSQGATSGIRSGRVTDVSVSYRFDNTLMEMQRLIVTEAMSNGGDSGAPVLDEQDKLVGIVVGGDGHTRTYIMPVYGLFANSIYTLLV